MSTSLQIFEEQRSTLLSLSYRMLGERSAAEDAVQETWLRWSAQDATAIDNPAAWLRRVATNIAIDDLRSARAQRERYVGPWLPEPLLTTAEEPAFDEVAQTQECELALLWAMERLRPAERAAFVLREAFDAEYAELASCLDKSEAACRQLVSRAHRKLREAGPRFVTSDHEAIGCLQGFFTALAEQDRDAALALVSADVEAYTDGGGKRRASLRPLLGAREVVNVFASIVSKYLKEEGWRLELGRANGAPALLRYGDEGLDTVTVLTTDDASKIRWIYVMRNPDKLPTVPAPPL